MIYACLSSILQHTKNRIIDQRSLMTTIPTSDLLAMVNVCEKAMMESHEETLNLSENNVLRIQSNK